MTSLVRILREIQMFLRGDRSRATVSKCSALGMEIKRKKIRESAVFPAQEVSPPYLLQAAYGSYRECPGLIVWMAGSGHEWVTAQYKQ